MYIIYIDQLKVMASIGIYDWEKKCLQRLIFDLQIAYDNIFLKFNLNMMYLDYIEINKMILSIVNKRHFLLIENVAEILMNDLIARFPIISWVRVRVNKPDAMRNASNVGVCVEKKNISKIEKISLYTGWR